MLLKITICLLFLVVVGFIVMRFMANNLSAYEIYTKNFPMYMIIFADIWFLLVIAFIGCFIATVILW